MPDAAGATFSGTPVRWPTDTCSLTLRHEDFTVSSMPSRFAEAGDVWRSFYELKPRSLDAALEMYARDERELGTGKYGGAEMPYPPDYPKMPGEPSRVQPSRMTNETREKEGLA